MNTLCECEELTHIKVEADIGADPLWCEKCGYNLDIEELKLSDALKQELNDWIKKYGTWIDFESDLLIKGNEAIELQHNALGLLLTEKLIKELVGKYKVSFSPSEYIKIESLT